jgi:hypothetical protein
MPRTPFRYYLWDHHIVSDFELGDLEPASENIRTLGVIDVELSHEHWEQPEGCALLESRGDDRQILFASWKSGDAYIAHYPGFCRFRIFPEQMRIECAPEPGLAGSTVAHMILDHAIPRLLAVRPGYLVIHASAVQVENQVIAILGSSGQGKSTLAAWFASHGFPLLTDDCLVLQLDPSTRQWLAQPSYHSVRLWPDSIDALDIPACALREFAHYSSKRRTGKQAEFRFATGGSPLDACFVLAGPPYRPSDSGANHAAAPVIRELSVNESFLELVRAVFRLDGMDECINRQEFEALTSLTNTTRFSSLSYEREYCWLPEVQKAIMQTIQAGSHEPDDKEHT